MFKVRELLPYLALDELRASCHAVGRRPIFGAKLETWRHKILHIFHFAQTDRVLGIVASFLWIFNAISSEKRCLISVSFLLTYIDVSVPACWILVGHFQCPALRPYEGLGQVGWILAWKGHSELWDRADLDTKFLTLKKGSPHLESKII